MWTIYKVICDKDPNTVYIGSTMQDLAQRLYRHKSDARSWKGNSPKWKWMLDNYYDLKIVEIEDADSEIGALFRERWQIIKHRRQGYNVLNKILPGSRELLMEELLKRGITVQEQYRKCGKKPCSTCGTGRGHGPYLYAYWRENGRIRSFYIGKELPLIISKEKE